MKRIFALVLVLIMLCLLFACGKAETEQPNAAASETGKPENAAAPVAPPMDGTGQKSDEKPVTAGQDPAAASGKPQTASVEPPVESLQPTEPGTESGSQQLAEFSPVVPVEEAFPGVVILDDGSFEGELDLPSTYYYDYFAERYSSVGTFYVITGEEKREYYFDSSRECLLTDWIGTEFNPGDWTLDDSGKWIVTWDKAYYLPEAAVKQPVSEQAVIGAVYYFGTQLP